MSRAVVERLAVAPSERLLANRATGRIRLSLGAKGSRTHRTRVHEAGSLRVRFPTAASGMLEAVLINTAGGMTGGDDFSISLSLDEGAQLLAGTAAAEKIYRSTGSDTALALTIDAVAGSRCVWLPQETILFDRARLSRRIDVNLSTDATLLMAEAIVFGRSAMGEAVEEGNLTDRWRVRRGGQMVFAENIRLDGAIARKLTQPAIANGGVAIATVLAVPGDEQMIAAVRDCCEQFAGEVGISAWNGIAVARLCAPDGAALRHDLAALLSSLDVGMPRLWLQ
jgi:urease accessory protein